MYSFLEKTQTCVKQWVLIFLIVFVSKKTRYFDVATSNPRTDPQELRISFAHRSKLSPFDPSVAWLSTKKKYKVTLYGTNISHHLWKTKIIFNIDFSGDMLVPRWVLVINGVMGKWPKAGEPILKAFFLKFGAPRKICRTMLLAHFYW